MTTSSETHYRAVMRALAGQLRVLLCAIAIALAVSAPAQAGSGTSRSCSAGGTLYRKGSVRAFVVQKTDFRYRLQFQVLYACLSRWGRPRVLYSGDVGTITGADMFHQMGRYLGFRVDISGGTSDAAALGWINTRTGAVRTAVINAGPSEDSHDPAMPEEALAYAIASDGAIAMIGTEVPFQEVGLLLPGRKEFKPLKSLAFAPEGGLDKHFIQITPATVIWRASSGMTVAANR